MSQPSEDYDRLYRYGKTLTAVFNLRTGKRLSLSDLFYDGANYIDLINSEIVSQTEEVSGWGSIEYEWTQKRSFSGLPRDYPYFYVTNGPFTSFCLTITRFSRRAPSFTSG
jgi:hypothetical protein